jgi:putative transposase
VAVEPFPTVTSLARYLNVSIIHLDIVGLWLECETIELAGIAFLHYMCICSPLQSTVATYVLAEPAIRDLATIFARVCEDLAATLVEVNGEDDHVHLLVEYPPQASISKLVDSLKGVSSRLISEIKGRSYKGVLWSPSYFAASCGGAPIQNPQTMRVATTRGRASPPP